VLEGYERGTEKRIAAVFSFSDYLGFQQFSTFFCVV